MGSRQPIGSALQFVGIRRVSRAHKVPLDDALAAIDAEHRLGVAVHPSVRARTREIGATDNVTVDASPGEVPTAAVRP